MSFAGTKGWLVAGSLALVASGVFAQGSQNAQGAQAAQGSQLPAGVQPALPAPVTQPLPANRWTRAQIREAFQLADADANGQLTRAEAQHLAIMPRSFEDTDTDKDGVLSAAEYESSFAP